MNRPYYVPSLQCLDLKLYGVKAPPDTALPRGLETPGFSCPDPEVRATTPLGRSAYAVDLGSALVIIRPSSWT